MDGASETAGRLLARVFAALEVPLTFRLWDGTAARVGAAGESPFAVVVRSASALRRLLRHPTPLGFGEAFIDGEIDIEGDLFAAMAVANRIEQLRVPFAARLAVLGKLLRP
jgi:cyclopropane-fatty-acyl-phospholipid synthase